MCQKLLIFSIGFFLIGSLSAQVEREDPTGEFKINILNTILLGSVELGYEHFLSKDQSLGVEYHFNDRFAYRSLNGDKDFNSNVVLVAYNFYFPDQQSGNIYVFPFLKYRFGDYSESNDGVLTVTNMNSAFLGIGAGYKWVFANNFAIGPYASIARGFNSEFFDTFSPVEFKAGFSVGYRF
jgi:outer membrane receptor for Fe3+-dicitrate